MSEENKNFLVHMNKFDTVIHYLIGWLHSFRFRCLLLMLFLGLSVSFPNLIAHGRLVTTDIYLTATVIASLWAFHVFLRFPEGKSAFILGILLGLVSVFKFSGILLYIVFPLILVFLFLRQRILGNTVDCYFVINKKDSFLECRSYCCDSADHQFMLPV